jgi:hypothetical protein
VFGELLGTRFVREPPAYCLGLLVDDLDVAEFVEEYVVKHESTHGKPRPLAAANRPELRGRLAPS